MLTGIHGPPWSRRMVTRLQKQRGVSSITSQYLEDVLGGDLHLCCLFTDKNGQFILEKETGEGERKPKADPMLNLEPRLGAASQDPEIGT